MQSGSEPWIPDKQILEIGQCRSEPTLLIPSPHVRPAQASLALRPAGSLSRLTRPLSRGFSSSGHPAEPLVSYRINRQLSGWNLPPPMIRAFGAHCRRWTSFNLFRFWVSFRSRSYSSCHLPRGRFWARSLLPCSPFSRAKHGFQLLPMAFSLTPSRCAIARLLIPWLFSISMLRRRFPQIRRRPRRQPSSRPSAAIPPCA